MHGPEWHSTPRGAHFLSRALAARLVDESDLRSGELVFDLGAGQGAITAAIAAAGGRVVAVERDPKLVGRLERRFSDNSLVRVVHGDVRTVPLPRKPFRVVANIPFGVTTELLRRLLDSPVNAADIVVAAGVCIAVTADRPGNIRVLRWATRYSLRRGRRLPAHCFRPPPSVDAGTLVIRRRPEPLLRSPAQRRAFDALVAAGYRHADGPWERSVSGLLTHRQAVRIAASRELPLGTAVRELSVHDWVAAAEIVAR
ncbi:MAG TPA: rRNA adenine N-6-methyltransferase family protein [Mycobacteriales bacterium]|nr:rRNA adenine N-6-methyltransferase family protein [Mycobacteriales bacterium]